MYLTDNTRDRKKYITNCIFLSINFLKISCRKRWKWHFRDPKFKNFWSSICPQTSQRWAAFGTTTFLPRVRTPTKSHAAPLKKFIKSFLYELTVVCADCLLSPVAVTAVIMASSNINKLSMMISSTSSRDQICQKLLSCLWKRG